MQATFLTTDLLIWLLCVLVLLSLVLLRGNENARSAWQSIKARPSAMIALVILILFFAIALLDSLHLRPVFESTDGGSGSNTSSGETLSLLDMTLGNINDRTETTYSAPLAIYGFSKIAATDKSASQVRVYPRLENAGSHLKTAGDHQADLLKLTLIGLVKGTALGIGILLGYLFYASLVGKQTFSNAWLQLASGKTLAAWRSILLTCFLLAVMLSCGFELGSQYHLFGTDKVGQDVFYQALKSIRTGILIGSLTLLIMTPLAIIFGIIAGYFGGLADDIIQYLYTTVSSIPGVLLIAAAILSLDVYLDTQIAMNSISQRADIRLLSLCVILGVTDWISLCRLLRGESMKLRELPYVQAATALGLKDRRLLSRHILPNVLHIVLITVALQFSGLVLAEAVLSYVGVGVDPSMISWGNMINGARLEMAREPVVWWSLTAALLFMFALILSANLFADAVRDALDPRLRGS